MYLTSDAREAAVYAALAPLGGRGHVYEVEPDGALEPDPPWTEGSGSSAVPAATVVVVVRRAVGLDADALSR